MRAVELEPDSAHARFAAIALGVVGVAVFILQPGFVQGFVADLGLTEAQAGLAASAELVGIATTSMLAAMFAGRASWRWLTALGLALAAIGTAASAILDGDGFLAARLVSGLGCGVVIAISFAAIGLTTDPDRNFAYYITAVLSYGAIGLFALPAVFNEAGVGGAFWAISILFALCLALVPSLPRGGRALSAAVEPDARAWPRASACAALVGMLAYNVGQGLAWAYAFLVGVDAGVAERDVANALSVSQLFGVAGALTPLLIVGRVGRGAQIVAAIIGGVCSMALLVMANDIAAYAIAIVAMNYFWNLFVPTFLAALAVESSNARLVLWGVTLQFVGLALGPALGAWLLARGGSFDIAISAAATAFAAALVLVWPLLANTRRQRQAISA